MADTLGYSVVTPLKPTALEELLDLLPMPARQQFPSDPETLSRIIAKGIGEDGPPWDPPPFDPEIEFPAPTISATAPYFGFPPNSPRRYLTAVLIAAMVLIAACFAFYWFWAG
jgi:hypothetical protein